MSTRSPVTRNDGTNWNSICVTSGAPLPALSEVRSLVYSSDPCPALTSFTLMLGWARWNMSTCCCRSGTHDQSVRVTGPCSRSVDLLPPPPQADSVSIAAVTRTNALRHSRRRVRLLVPFISPSPIVRDPWLFQSLEQASVPAAERELLALWDLAAVVQVRPGGRQARSRPDPPRQRPVQPGVGQRADIGSPAGALPVGAAGRAPGAV